MTIDELEEKCQQVIADGGSMVHLVLPWREFSGEGIRLTKRRGPIGWIANAIEGKRITASFGAAAVLRFIEREKLREQRNDR